MAKRTASRLENMPSNFVTIKPRPVTLSQYLVVDARDHKKVLKEENRLWYAIDNAGRRDAQGESVEVLGWDDTIGKHRPISEYMTKVNNHGDVEGDWRSVFKQRQNAARASRKTAPKETSAKAVKRDEYTAERMKKMSMILNVASSAIRKGELPEDQLADLYQELDSLSSHIFSLLPDDVPSDEELATAE